MDKIFRLMASALAALAAYFFIYWIPLAMITLPGEPLSSVLVSLAGGVLAGWIVWRQYRAGQSGPAPAALAGALIVGGVGFTAGFFGPMVFAPEANQGPLLGIFITGPLGFLAGGLGGVVFWLCRKRRSRRADNHRQS